MNFFPQAVCKFSDFLTLNRGCYKQFTGQVKNSNAEKHTEMKKDEGVFCSEAIAIVENRPRCRIWLNSEYSKEKCVGGGRRV